MQSPVYSGMGRARQARCSGSLLSQFSDLLPGELGNPKASPSYFVPLLLDSLGALQANKQCLPSSVGIVRLSIASVG